MDTYLISWIQHDGTLRREVRFCTEAQAKKMAQCLFDTGKARFVNVRATFSVMTIEKGE